MILQLHPQIPMICPKGAGQAIALLDYSEEHELIWVIAIDATGEIWSYQNSQVRMQKNITMNRLLQESQYEKGKEENHAQKEEVKRFMADLV